MSRSLGAEDAPGPCSRWGEWKSPHTAASPYPPSGNLPPKFFRFLTSDPLHKSVLFRAPEGRAATDRISWEGTMEMGASAAVTAHVVLPGHADTPARVDVDAVPFRARLLRTLVMAGVWGTISAAMFFITVFDP